MTTATLHTIPSPAYPPTAGRCDAPAHEPPCGSCADARWSSVLLKERLEWAGRARIGVAERADELLKLMETEVGKPRWEGLTGDLMPLLASLRWHERNAGSVLKSRSLRGRPAWLPGQAWTLQRHPLGRVGIIATWNYPVQLLGIQMLQALVAGNTVSVKPSEHSPRTQEALCSIFERAGLPEGTLRVWRATREAGAQMLREEKLDHVVFTGSTAVGREVANWAADRLVPTTLELTGRDSAFVLAGADPALAARSIWAAVTLNGGQTCMAPRRVLVERAVYARFLAALAPLVAGSSPRSLINAAAAERAFGMVMQSVGLGARSLSGTLEPPRGSVVRAIALVDCPAHAPLVSGDHFAPMLAVVPVDSWAEAVGVHRANGPHLAASVFGGPGCWRGGACDRAGRLDPDRKRRRRPRGPPRCRHRGFGPERMGRHARGAGAAVDDAGCAGVPSLAVAQAAGGHAGAEDGRATGAVDAPVVWWQVRGVGGIGGVGEG